MNSSLKCCITNQQLIINPFNNATISVFDRCSEKKTFVRQQIKYNILIKFEKRKYSYIWLCNWSYKFVFVKIGFFSTLYPLEKHIRLKKKKKRMNNLAMAISLGFYLNFLLFHFTFLCKVTFF